MDLSLPLGCQKMGPRLDKEQKTIIKYKAGDLVLIEDATDIIKDVIVNGDDHLEWIMEEIAKYYNVAYLRSETFSMVDVDEERCFLAGKLLKETERYKRDIQKDLKKNNIIITIIGLDLGKEAGGHYASVIYNKEKNTIHLFDSISCSKEESPHIWQFECVLKLVFGKEVKFIKPQISHKACLQYSGGFANNYCYSIGWDRMPDLKIPKIYLPIQNQCTEAQNHFCYMWTLWYIQSYLSGLNVSKIADDILSYKVDPLVVIKTYVWQIINLPIGPQKKKLRDLIDPELLKFFDTHFSSIWTNDPNRTFNVSLDFKRYKINYPKPAKNIQECFDSTIIPIKITEEKNYAHKNIATKCRVE